MTTPKEPGKRKKYLEKVKTLIARTRVFLKPWLSRLMNRAAGCFWWILRQIRVSFPTAALRRFRQSAIAAFARIKKTIFPFRFNSVKFEISVIYSLILGVILASFSGLFYVITSRTLYEELDNELRIKSEGINENINSYLAIKGEKPQTLQYAVEKTVAQGDKTLRRWWYIGFERSWFRKLDEQDLRDDFVNFISVDHSFSVQSAKMTGSLLERFLNDTELEQGKEKYWDIDLDDKEIRVINYPFPQEGEPTHIIQIGISKGPVIHLLNKWMMSVFLSIPVILILTGFIGRLLASRILRPLNRITNTASRISNENLNLRVEPKLHYREMDRLIQVFNDMIARLERSFEHIDKFSTHVAHELKTPLTIIRGEAELGFMGAKSNEQKTAMKTIIGEIDKVLKTIEDLLFLSKTSYQPEAFQFEEIELIEFLSEIAGQIRLIAKGKNIQILFSEPRRRVVIRADRLHLRRLFLNLLDNALKFTPEQGQITIEMFIRKEWIHVSVVDTGPGISKQNISKVFDQFFREEHKPKGIGLGLSIAQAIAKVHNTEITVQSQPSQGTRFTVILPVVRSYFPAFV